MADGVTVKDWEVWTEDVIGDWHLCSEQRNDEIGVFRRDALEVDSPGWTLGIVEPATEDDVRKGVAPELGVPSRMIAIKIAACPFCGARLA
jgi:hypothetical protein